MILADSDDYGISGDQCGNDHEETDSQEFQDEYRRARIAEEKRSERFVPLNSPYRYVREDGYYAYP